MMTTSSSILTELLTPKTETSDKEYVVAGDGRTLKPESIYIDGMHRLGISRHPPDPPGLKRKDTEIITTTIPSINLPIIFVLQLRYHRSCSDPN